MGVGGIQKKRLEDKKFVAKADELAENQVEGSRPFGEFNMFLVFLVGRIVQPAFKLPGEFGNICKRAQAGDSERSRVQAPLSRDVLQHWS